MNRPLPWFRWYVNTLADPKLTTVARRGVSGGEVDGVPVRGGGEGGGAVRQAEG